MKKTFMIVALFLCLLIVSAAFNKTERNTTIGKDAPEITINTTDDTIDLNSLKGKYVLLSFWASGNAQSRAAVNNYTAWINSHKDSNLRYVGINFDDSETLFNEIVRLDSLNPAQQYNVRGNDAKNIEMKYQLDDGYGSLLIDPEGKIIAHNPTDIQLVKFVGTPAPDRQ